MLDEMPLKDCDAWIAALLKKNELLGQNSCPSYFGKGQCKLK